MKKIWLLLTLVLILMGPVGLIGCKNNDKAANTETAETQEKDAGAAEKPADAKPKDHPAH